jgi:hypothetical protein
MATGQLPLSQQQAVLYIITLLITLLILPGVNTQGLRA